MGHDAKLRYFQALLHFGYKEIEVSYPSAGDVEYDFTRRLIDNGDIPDDVWIQVMAPCREDLIRTTIESVRGVKQVILHIHLSTSDCFRDIVFNMTEKEMVDLAVRCARLIRDLTKDSPDPEMRQTEWVLEFTPENFQSTSVEYALEICEAIKAVWNPTEHNQIIFNLASTVEMAMPNVFADQVEYFSTHISERQKVCISLHNHNDRGCAVATSEMGQLAGADRVEGCLFGNGERTGNVDLVTLAMNLYTQGIHPKVDFREINQVVDMVEQLTKIPVHYRAPYSGKLTFCTFTGTHQDAIRKGYARRATLQQTLRTEVKWMIPYLPMDPSDLGRKHEAIIRLNSQSGKGGIGWFISEIFNITLPKELEIALTKLVKAHSINTGQEVTHEIIQQLFEEHYMLSECKILDRLGPSLPLGKAATTTVVTSLTNDDTNGAGQTLTERYTKDSCNNAMGEKNHPHSEGTNGCSLIHVNGHQETKSGQQTVDESTLQAHSKKVIIPLAAVVRVNIGNSFKPIPSRSSLKMYLDHAAASFGYRLQIQDDEIDHITSTGETTASPKSAVFVKLMVGSSYGMTPGVSGGENRSATTRSLDSWGVGMNLDPVQASLQALSSAIANLRATTQSDVSLARDPYQESAPVHVKAD